MRNRPLGSLCLAVFLFLCLLIRFGGARFIPELAPSPLERSGTAGEKVRLTGRVYQKEQRDDFQIFYLEQVSVFYPAPSGAEQTSFFTEPRILVYDEQDIPAAVGSCLSVYGKVTLYERERNPGNFNQKLYWQKQNIHGYVWASSAEVISESTGGCREWLYTFRTRWRDRLHQILGDRDGGILCAMLLGEKNGMDPELKELYQTNGIGHVLAISGLHLSFIGLGVYRLLRRLTGSYPAGAAAGILFLSLYVLMIGLTVSALRALILFLFRVGADLTGRHYDGPTALAAAAVAVLLWRPLNLYDGAFWLSFGAILAVQLILPLGESFLARPRLVLHSGDADADKPAARIRETGLRLAGAIGRSLWASAGITCMLLPVLLYYFYEIPPYSVFLNLVVIPLMSGILFLGLSGSLLCFLSVPVGSLILKICRVIFRLYEFLCRKVLYLPGARLTIGQPEQWQVFSYYFCLAAALFFLWHLRARQKEDSDRPDGRSRRNKENRPDEKRRRLRALRRVWLRAGMILTFGLFLLCARFGENDRLTITMLDVGQGDGIFIQSPTGVTCFVDGGSSDVKQVGKYRIEPFLKSRGVDRLDYVFISHGDRDHLSGIQEMMERQDVGIRIGCLVLTPRKTWDEGLLSLAQTAVDCDVPVDVLKTGEAFRAGDLSMTCLWPAAEPPREDGNELSMVLALSYRDFDMLFTGDLGQEEEPCLLENMAAFCPGRNIEILKVAHHGSRNSTSREFLETVRPSFALISAGRNNHYGHPHAETLKRLEEAGSMVCTTQEAGAITVSVNKEGNSFSVEKYLEAERKD